MSGAEYLPGFSKMIFKGAVKFLKKKTALTKEEYEALSDRAKAKAFTVAGYAEAVIIQEYLDSLTEAVEQGKTLSEWKQEMDTWLEQHGYEGMEPFKAHVIFETNIQTAYNAVYKYDDPFWKVWYPPNGFRCRCHVRSYSEAQIQARRLEVQKRPPFTVDTETGEMQMLHPDKGFSRNPARDIWKPDLAKLSPKVRKVYRNRTAKE